MHSEGTNEEAPSVVAPPSKLWEKGEESGTLHYATEEEGRISCQQKKQDKTVMWQDCKTRATVSMGRAKEFNTGSLVILPTSVAMCHQNFGDVSPLLRQSSPSI